MRAGVTQQHAADHIGVSLRVYQNYEQDTRRPKYENLAELARMLAVTSDWLLGLTDKR